jgi:hypothetical protein
MPPKDPSRPPLREDDMRYLPGIYDALRAITYDAPGQWVRRLELGRELCRWIGRHGKPIPPVGTLNRVLRRAGYRRGRFESVHVVYGLKLRG